MNTCESCTYWKRVEETRLGNCNEKDKGYPYGVHGVLSNSDGYLALSEHDKITTGKDFGCIKYKARDIIETPEHITTICDCSLCKQLNKEK